MAKAGAARVFFDVIGQLQSEKLLGDTRAAMVVQEAIVLDTISSIADTFSESTSYIIDAVNSVTAAFFEFEEQFVRVRKFYNAGEGEVRAFAEAAQEMGHAFAFTGAESLAAAARTAQLKAVLGSQLAVIEATRQGLLMAQVGEMETELGMNRFIALAQQTQFLMGGLTQAQYDNLTAEQQANLVREASIHALNQLNTIENTSVATMEDITFVLNQFASQADIAGESIGDMAAMSALLLETGEEVSRAGTGLRMIYQRLGNANNEATKAIAELIPGLDAQGVAQLKLTDVIERITPAYNAMSAEEKRALAVSIAGSRHYIKFLKIMENQHRLTQMQTDAFNTLYPAIEEFENKTKSAVFQATQMEAKINDMKVAIGEDLAEAYMTSYRAQETFLKGAKAVLEIPGMDKVAGNVIAASNAYQQLIQPLAELALRVVGITVAFKAYQASRPDAINKTRIEAMEYKKLYDARTLENLANEKGILTTFRSATALNREQQSVLSSANALVRKRQAERGALEEKIRNIRAKKEDALLALQEAQSAGEAEKALRKLSGALRSQGNQLQKNIALRGQSMTNQRIANNDLIFEKQISQQLIATKATREVIDKRSITTMFQSLGLQEKINQSLTAHANAMANEVVLSEQLDSKTLKRLTTRQADLLSLQEEARHRLMVLQTERAELLSKGKTTIAIDEKIAKTRENIMTLNQERIAITQVITADEQLAVAQKKAGASTMSFTQSMKASHAAMIEGNMYLKTTQKTLMGFSLLFPMIVDGSKQMSATMYTMSLMMLSQAIPAIIKMTKGIKSMGMALHMSTGGLTAITGALVTLGAYLGFELFDSIFGDNFNSDLDNLGGLNDELNRTSAILAELSGTAGQEAVLTGVFDMSFNDLKQNAELAQQTLDDIHTRRLRFEQAHEAAVKRGDVATANAYEDQISKLSVVEQQVSAITEAQDFLSNADFDMGQQMLDSLVLTEKELTKRIAGMEVKYGEVYTVGYVTPEGALKEVASFEGYYEDIFSEFADGNEALNEAQKVYNKELASIRNAYFADGDEFTKEYYESLLKVEKDGQDDLADSHKQFYDTLTQQQNEFANAREELFFGERSNFTGAIYKQITQGGVESLLHKVELIQTNNFNGMTLPEMVEQVTQGVTAELRAQGVPI